MNTGNCRIHTIVFAALFGVAPALLADDLVETYRLARQNDPGLRAAEAQRMAAREAIPLARAALLPNLSLGAAADRVHSDPDSSLLDSESYNQAGYSLSLRQTVYNRDQFIQRDQAEELVRQADVTYEATVQNLFLDVARRYFDVLSKMDNLRFVQANKKAIERQLEQTRQRFEVGLIAITDVHEAQARFDLSVAQEILAQNQLATSKESLRELTAVIPKEFAPLRRELELIKPDPENIDEWVAFAEQNNLELTAARHGLNVAREEIRRQAAGHYPVLDLVGSHAYRDTDREFANTDGADSRIGLELLVPLYTGGAITSRTRQAEFNYQRASETLEQQWRATERSTRDAYRLVIDAISQVRALEQARISSQSALEATEAGFEVGTRTIVDVLDAQQEVFLAERNHADARYAYLVATLALKQAAGTLNLADLEQVNEWLE